MRENYTDRICLCEWKITTGGVDGIGSKKRSGSYGIGEEYEPVEESEDQQ